MKLDKVKIGQVIKTTYSPEWAKENNLLGHLHIKLGEDSYLTTNYINKDGIHDMKGRSTYSESTFERSYGVEMSDISLISIESIKFAIKHIFR